MLKFSFLFASLAFLSACSSHKDEEKNLPLPEKPVLEILPAKEPIRVTGDSVEIPSFEIELDLSTKAEEKLRSGKESIIVAAYFSGIPRDTTNKDYIKYGETAISSVEKKLTTARIAKFEGIKFLRSLYESLAPGSLHILINVYSGRRSTNMNLLDCDILQSPVNEMKSMKYVLKGKLIGE